MDDEIPGPHKEMARRFRAFLTRRNLTVNSATERFGLSRETLTRMYRGNTVHLVTVEKWAEVSGEDTNEWRELAGYQRVTNHTHRFFEEIARLQEEAGDDFQVSAEELVMGGESSEALEQLMEQVRARVLAHRQGP
jgi:transcriptional regulator with XRE-family HTH domain